MIGIAGSKTTGTHEDAARGGKTLSALAVNEEFRGTFLLKRVEVKKARNGKEYLDLEVGDASGALAGKMWDAGTETLRGLSGCDFVEASGKVELYNERRQAKFTALRASEAKIDPRDFLPRSPFDPRERLARL